MDQRHLAGPLALKTVEEHVVDVLRERIVRGALQPGDALRLTELSALLGVSTMPVRHALRRLEAERLVRQLPRRGAVVAPLELDDLEEIQAIRGGIEGLAARKGVDALTSAHTKQMRKMLAALDRAAQAGKLDAFLLSQWEIYDTCYKQAGRPRLLSLIVEHRRRAERYIRLALTSGDGLEESFSIQSGFVDACEGRDAAAAEEVIRLAMGWTVDSVAAQLSSFVPI